MPETENVVEQPEQVEEPSPVIEIDTTQQEAILTEIVDLLETQNQNYEADKQEQIDKEKALEKEQLEQEKLLAQEEEEFLKSSEEQQTNENTMQENISRMSENTSIANDNTSEILLVLTDIKTEIQATNDNLIKLNQTFVESSWFLIILISVLVAMKIMWDNLSKW